MNAFHDLEDHHWAAVGRLLPRCGPGGADYRSIVNGILWQQNGGRRWHDMPARYGPWHRCAERLRLWNADGTWQAILTILADSGHPVRCADSGQEAEPTATTGTDRTTEEDWNRPWMT
ncbi:transposase [Streptomyces sp. NPDC002138]|uniref:transposase n=1 Tax=Streptomyces sp. NPDC002138 TaxID=3154410 RepID=UPI003316E450